jgi:hypothetical protein
MNRDLGKTKIAIVETSCCHNVAVPLPQSAECKLKREKDPEVKGELSFAKDLR